MKRGGPRPGARLALSDPILLRGDWQGGMARRWVPYKELQPQAGGMAEGGLEVTVALLAGATGGSGAAGRPEKGQWLEGPWEQKKGSDVGPRRRGGGSPADSARILGQECADPQMRL